VVVERKGMAWIMVMGGMVLPSIKEAGSTEKPKNVDFRFGKRRKMGYHNRRRGKTGDRLPAILKPA
jgi:hypothetical protein